MNYLFLEPVDTGSVSWCEMEGSNRAIQRKKEGLCLRSDLHHSKWKMIRFSGLRIQLNPLSFQHNPVVWINPELSLEYLPKTYILNAYLCC